MIAGRCFGERLRRPQWLGVRWPARVALVVLHKIDCARSPCRRLSAVCIALAPSPRNDLQRIFCPAVICARPVSCNCRHAGRARTAGGSIEGFPMHWAWPLVGSIMFLVVLHRSSPVNALHLLMRRGRQLA